MDLELQCGPITGVDGQKNAARGDRLGGLVTSSVSGRYYENTFRENLYVYHIASQALLLSATTGGHPTVINPTGSGVIFVPLGLRIGFTSGTTVIGSVLIAETLNVGGGAATGAPILTATLVDSKSARRPAGRGRCLWSPTTNTFTAAPTVIAATGLNLGAAAPTGTGTYETNFDGSLAFEPGSAMSIVYSVTTSTALFHVTLFGLELPYVM